MTIKKHLKSALIYLPAVAGLVFAPLATAFSQNTSAASFDYNVNLSDLTFSAGSSAYEEILNFTQDDYADFLAAYTSGSLPAIYTTDFLYDGAGMVKTPDLDDFIEAGSDDAKIKTLSIKAVNINTSGDISFTGSLTGGMIALDTNDLTADANIILNGVSLDTDSKKAPAVYVYNKDINYTDHKVTIKTTTGSNNYLEGGKFKKVSLVGSDELSSYAGRYSGTAATYYNNYPSYYGIYTSAEAANVRFAKVTADNEDLQDGDPYYFYKGSGVISSDIDLEFNGTGNLSVVSKKKEGIETKGNLTFSGGTGEYYIEAMDDALNTTTSRSAGSTVRNTLTIDVARLGAVVNADADEGDAIDSNGELIINGGEIYAFAHPTSGDDGLDSDGGTYINGGTVFATGNMSDAISENSAQDFMKLNFASAQPADTIITITDANYKPIIALGSARQFKTLTYSSPDLTKSTYHVFTNGAVNQGSDMKVIPIDDGTNVVVSNIKTYTLGTEQQYSSAGNNGGPGGMDGGPSGTPGSDGFTPGSDGFTPGSDGFTPGDGGTPPSGGPDGFAPGDGSVPGADDSKPGGPSGGFGGLGLGASDGYSNFFLLAENSHTFNGITDFAESEMNGKSSTADDSSDTPSDNIPDNTPDNTPDNIPSDGAADNTPSGVPSPTDGGSANTPTSTETHGVIATPQTGVITAEDHSGTILPLTWTVAAPGVGTTFLLLFLRSRRHTVSFDDLP